VAIIDWDVHHGNGTQRIFYDDPSVLYVSLHQYPHYPGSGSILEKGVGEGRGYTINFPLTAGSDDEDYITIFEENIVPALENFKPQFLFISAGFDGHEKDFLGGMALTDHGYAKMTDILVQVSLRICDKGLVSVLEGGYNLETLPETVLTHIRALAGSSTSSSSQQKRDSA
jgi:acetoin utilization deacetylase AcuC-like enzyme